MPNIKIRSMHGQVSTFGLFLESNDFLCPKLRPGEVVEVPDDHPVFESESMTHIEITREPPNRPYRFGTLAEANAQTMSPEQAVEAATMIGTSMHMSAKIRQDNFAALQKLKDEGNYQPEAMPDFGQADQQQGLGAARPDNAVLRSDDAATEDAPPAARSRRRQRAG